MTAWDYTESRELVCIGYGMPREGLEAVPDDQRVAYLCASQEVIVEDNATSELLDQYLGEKDVEEGSKICLFNQVQQSSKPKKPNREKRPFMAGKMSHKVNVMHQRVDKSGWLHERKGTSQIASAPEVPTVLRQVLVQEALVPQKLASVKLGKKYKPVAKKITPILSELPVKFCIRRKIMGSSSKHACSHL
jgi:hypothetical protein